MCYVPLSQLGLPATLGMSDVHNVLPSAALLGSSTLIPLVSFMESDHLLFVLFFLLSSTFPSITVFSKEPCLLVDKNRSEEINIRIW